MEYIKVYSIEGVYNSQAVFSQYQQPRLWDWGVGEGCIEYTKHTGDGCKILEFSKNINFMMFMNMVK